jgi:hypothetical protein
MKLIHISFPNLPIINIRVLNSINTTKIRIINSKKEDIKVIKEVATKSNINRMKKINKEKDSDFSVIKKNRKPKVMKKNKVVMKILN